MIRLYMGEFVNFITKGIEFEKEDDRRIFSGHITAEVVDHQNDFIFVKEVMAVMDTFMKVLPVLSDAHSNRMIGKVLGYEKSEIEGHESVKITAEVFKQEGVSLYDTVWNKIKKGVYSGLSMGGGSKDRKPMMKDGRYVMELSNLELYEIAVCPSPANPLALIDKFNSFAKTEIGEKFHNVDGRSLVQCSSISCSFEKGVNKDVDVDIDNEKDTADSIMEKEGLSTNSSGTTNPVNDKKIANIGKDNSGNAGSATESSEIVEDTRRLEQFDKPEKENEVKKDHVPSMPEEKEEEARKKNDSMSKAIMNYIKFKDEIIEKNEKIIKELTQKLG